MAIFDQTHQPVPDTLYINTDVPDNTLQESVPRGTTFETSAAGEQKTVVSSYLNDTAGATADTTDYAPSAVDKGNAENKSRIKKLGIGIGVVAAGALVAAGAYLGLKGDDDNAEGVFSDKVSEHVAGTNTQSSDKLVPNTEAQDKNNDGMVSVGETLSFPESVKLTDSDSPRELVESFYSNWDAALNTSNPRFLEFAFDTTTDAFGKEQLERLKEIEAYRTTHPLMEYSHKLDVVSSKGFDPNSSKRTVIVNFYQHVVYTRQGKLEINAEDFNKKIEITFVPMQKQFTDENGTTRTVKVWLAEYTRELGEL